MWTTLPLEEVRRIGLPEEALEVSRRLRRAAEADDIPWDWLRPDYGHRESLEHFVRCYLNGEDPANSDALDASVACVTAVGAIQSIQTQRRVELQELGGATAHIDLRRGPKGR